MADIIDINVSETTETITINTTPNLTTININSVTGGGAVTSVNGQTGDVVISTSDNNFTNALKTKLDGIAAGAEVNVNADWNATSGDAQILNKPTIPSTANFVPYTGANQNVNLGTNDILLERVFLNDAVNGGYASIHYADSDFHIEDADGHKLLVIEDGFIQLHKTDTIQSNLFTTDLTQTRDHYLPNASGTIALTSDLANKVDKNTAITGATKTKITYDSKGLVTAGADATTADIADSTNKRYQTDNQNSFNDATSSIQTQLGTKAADNAVVHLSGTEIITGQKTFNASVTASGAIAKGTILTPTLNAAANSDVLVGLDIQPTFVNGGFTGVAQYGLRTNSNIQFNLTNKGIYGSSANTFINFGGSLELSGVTDLQLKVNNSVRSQLMATTGNLIVQNAGTFTDVASSRLTINSTTQGMLPPRMTTAQKNAIASPATGLVVYDTDLKTIANYNGTSWVSLTANAPSQQVYTGTITWTGTTAPSGATTHTYNWSLINNLVTLKITLVYATAGVSQTAVNVTLPTDCPAPLKPTGLTSASNNLYTGIGYLSQTTSSTAPTATRTILKANAANNGFEIISNGSTGIYAFSDIIVQYFTS